MYGEPRAEWDHEFARDNAHQMDEIHTQAQLYVITALTAKIRSALMNDEVLSLEEVRSVWSDEFLTNVIVPCLENVRNFFKGEEARYLEVGRRLSPVEVKEFQLILHNINSLTTTIHLMQAWRG